MDGPDPRDERVVGRYAIHGENASGGMATVHFGRLLGPVGFSRTVAIKRLHAQYAKDPEFVAMFLDEARLAARIQHPNVVSTLDVVALEGELLVVLEYVQGEALARLVRRQKKLGGTIHPRVVGSIVAGVLAGLHAAHEAKSERGTPLGIVHRDVSPQNVLVGADGVAKLLDFGVAKAAGRVQTTREGQIKGKLAYMAPEQLRGAPVDRRTDVWSAAVVLWETLCARRLFDADNEGLLLARVLDAPIPRPSEHLADLPSAIDRVVLRGLARDPEQRYPTAKAMAAEVEEALGLASPREVGEWVAAVAGDTLARRAERVKEIESATSRIPVLAAAPSGQPAPPRVPTPASGQRAAAADVPSQVSSVSMSAAPGRFPRSRNVSVAALGGAFVLVAFLSWWVGARSREPVAVVPASGAPSAEAAGDPSGPPATPAALPASVSASPSAPASASSKGRPRPPATGRARPSCDPPYVVGPDGIRKIKPECL